jgi:hypothetical protein
MFQMVDNKQQAVTSSGDNISAGCKNSAHIFHWIPQLVILTMTEQAALNVEWVDHILIVDC